MQPGVCPATSEEEEDRISVIYKYAETRDRQNAVKKDKPDVSLVFLFLLVFFLLWAFIPLRRLVRLLGGWRSCCGRHGRRLADYRRAIFGLGRVACVEMRPVGPGERSSRTTGKEDCARDQ